MTNSDIFNRAELLLGKDGLQRLSDARVIIFGVGGVGSWCAESLVRTGVGHLTIVDFDTVDVTNVNRQAMATSTTVGRVKVEAMRERLLDINPAADITALQATYSSDSYADFHLEDYDYIVDAIDSLQHKADLILKATSLPSSTRFVSSMGAALKIDPTKVEVAEFWKVYGCPLARALRQRFKRNKSFPQRKFKVVFSPEVRQAEGKGSLVHITAIFGFTLAGLIIQDLTDSRS